MYRNFLKFWSNFWLLGRFLKQKHLILELLNFFCSLSGFFFFGSAFWLLYIASRKNVGQEYWRCKFLGANKTRFAMNECQSMLHPPAGQIIHHH
jgi:hypothetical protein